MDQFLTGSIIIPNYNTTASKKKTELELPKLMQRQRNLIAICEIIFCNLLNYYTGNIPYFIFYGIIILTRKFNQIKFTFYFLYQYEVRNFSLDCFSRIYVIYKYFLTTPSWKIFIYLQFWKFIPEDINEKFWYEYLESKIRFISKFQFLRDEKYKQIINSLNV